MRWEVGERESEREMTEEWEGVAVEVRKISKL
jgi:hypothetical protein